MIVSSILANTSYLGHPMVYTLMGGKALTNAVLFDVVVSYLTLMIGAFGVGAAFGTKAGEFGQSALPLSLLRCSRCGQIWGGPRRRPQVDDDRAIWAHATIAQPSLRPCGGPRLPQTS